MAMRTALGGAATFAVVISFSVFSLMLSTSEAWPGTTSALSASSKVTSAVLPEINSQRGRRLFVTKGCVLCHSVNGVGGKAATKLDAEQDVTVVNVLDFVVRLWRGAWPMLELQRVDLGYQIEFESDEIADLAGFTMDASAQTKFSIDEVPEFIRRRMMDEPYWETGEWP